MSFSIIKKLPVYKYGNTLILTCLQTLNFCFFFHYVQQVLLAELTQRKEYLDAVKSFCDYTVNEQTRTPKGLVFIEKFGTLSHASNVAFICLQVHDFV